MFITCGQVIIPVLVLWDEPFHDIVLGQLRLHTLAGHVACLIVIEAEQYGSAYVPAESRNLIKKAYQVLNAQMENYMQNGKINPVAGIFLMKNNMGYVDKQEMVLTPNQQLGDQVSPEDLQRKYLEDTAGDYESSDSDE